MACGRVIDDRILHLLLGRRADQSRHRARLRRRRPSRDGRAMRAGGAVCDVCIRRAFFTGQT